MIVILLKNVKGTGNAGDVVKVSDGFARNRLLPKGLAKEATEGNIRNLNKQKEIKAEKEAAAKAAAEKLAEKLGKTVVEIKTKSGENGRLFGSITAKDIAGKLKEQFGITVDKKKILLDSPIKETGVFEIGVKLYPEIQGMLKVNVIV
jgi:large subunit ribosomal protein L9